MKILGKRWKNCEVEFLVKNYKTLSFDEIADKLSRSPSAVKRKGSYLGLSEPKNDDWSKEEVQFLFDNYKELNYKTIAKILNRPYLGVKIKGKRLGLNRTEYMSDVSLEGKTFGRLRVVKREFNGFRYGWSCLCTCGNTYFSETNQLTKGRVKSCGCLNLEQSTGEKHWNYNKNLTDIERLKNRYQLNGINLINWRTYVFEKNKYTCQVCLKIGGKLNAHHLYSWDSFPDKRFDKDNGVTLCVDCHKKFHGRFGYGNNTKEQFEEYTKTLV